MYLAEISDGRLDMKRKAIKLHKQFGHATSEKIIDLLRKAQINDKALDNEIGTVTKNCEICVRYKKAPPRPIVSLPMASYFKETVSMDLKSFGNVYFLVIVDMATRFCRATVIKDKRASTIAKGVITSWISIFGAMKKSLSDNGENLIMKSLGRWEKPLELGL